MAARLVTIKPLTLAEYQALVTGIPKNCPTASFGVAGQTFSAAQAVVFINTVLAAVAATAAAKTGWKDAQTAEATLLLQDGAIVRGIRETLATMFSNNTTVLADFLITPRKPYKPLSAEARTAANAKAAATRKARGTTGKAEKAAITGNVTGVTITPIVTGTSTGSTGTVAPPTPATPAGTATVANPSASTGSGTPATPAASTAAPHS